MNKLIKDGKVAVLVSPGYGAGWSTWNSPAEDLCMCGELAQAVIDFGAHSAQVLEVAERLFPDAYKGGLSDLVVHWLPVGTQFLIEEYDGSERLSTVESLRMTA